MISTRVAIATVVAISDSSYTPLGLVLEAPFNNLHDVIFNHPFSSPFRWMPRFEDILVKPLQASGLRMNSDTRIGRLSPGFCRDNFILESIISISCTLLV